MIEQRNCKIIGRKEYKKKDRKKERKKVGKERKNIAGYQSFLAMPSFVMMDFDCIFVEREWEH